MILLTKPNKKQPTKAVSLTKSCTVKDLNKVRDNKFYKPLSNSAAPASP